MIPAIAPDTAPSGCFANGSQVGGLSMFGGSMSSQVVDGHHHMLAVASSTSIDASSSSASAADTHSSSLLYSLSILKDKVQQVQSLVTILIAPAHQQTQSTSMAVASMGTLIQEIVVAASSMMFTCQQMNNSCSVPTATVNNANNAAAASAVDQELMQHQQRALFKPVNHGHGLQHHHHHHHHHQPGNNNNSNSMYPSDQTLDWFADNSYNSSVSVGNTSSQNSTRVGQSVRDQELPRVSGVSQRNNHHHHNNNNIDDGEGSRGYPLKTTNVGGTSGSFDIIELNAAELLAKYTHYCHICGKGFKRDANLRMHMRAHGDEYKTSSALSNPLKNGNNNNVNGVANTGADTNDNESNNNDTAAAPKRKYSCPHEGCRWNQRHAKFQPLKSMICVKNHYKRSHCPKMYVCKRCNRKQFSVLSDLRTHEKHCGDLKWQCSCGTTFSRKDKLMGHVALFVGHTPALPLGKPAGKIEGQAPASSASMQMDDRVEL